MKRSRAFVYILRCADGTLYTGYTIDLERRVRQHQSGRGGKYTRIRTPVELIYSESFRTRRAAMQREIHIKHMPRARKLKLVTGKN
jgi:putative endonuclease